MAAKAKKAELVKEESKELISIEALKPQEVFVDEGGVEKIIAEAKTAAQAEVAKIGEYDVNKEADRDKLVSAAFKVTRTKTGLEGMGKEYVGQLKVMTGLIDQRRRVLFAALEEIADEIRRPVTEYQEREKARIEGHNSRLEQLRSFLSFDFEPTSKEITERIAAASKLEDWDFEEFKEQADGIRQTVHDRLAEKLNETIQAEEDAKELEELRKEKAEREKQKQIDDAAALAATKAIDDAKETANKAAQAEIDKANRETARLKKIQDDKDEADRQAAAEQKRKDEDKDHRAAVLKSVKETIQAIIDAPVPEGSSVAKEITLAIKNGKIPNTTFKF